METLIIGPKLKAIIDAFKQRLNPGEDTLIWIGLNDATSLESFINCRKDFRSNRKVWDL